MPVHLFPRPACFMPILWHLIFTYRVDLGISSRPAAFLLFPFAALMADMMRCLSSSSVSSYGSRPALAPLAPVWPDLSVREAISGGRCLSKMFPSSRRREGPSLNYHF